MKLRNLYVDLIINLNLNIDLNDKIKLIQIIGNQFCDQNYKPLISHNTGFNLSILKSMNGKIENLIFKVAHNFILSKRIMDN